MIITEKVEISIATSNMRYWRNMGYCFDNPSPRWGKIPRINVLVEDLQEKSNVDVQCVCDKCNKEYTQRFSRDTDVCYDCRKSESMKGNNHGHNNKGKKMPHMSGELHPRWNPNKSEYSKYASEVMRITRQQDLTVLENYDKPRGLCGVEGAYQLDHIISIKYGFDNNISPDIIGSINNLQFITWQENRAKWYA